MIPIYLRTVTTLDFFKGKLSLPLTTGLHYCINTNGAHGTGYANLPPRFESTETYDYGLRKTFPLVETGLGVEWPMARRMFTVALSCSYFTGFTRTVTGEVHYREHGGPIHTAKFFSRSEFSEIAVGLRYRFGHKRRMDQSK
jgi:hypothetical protein